MTKKQQPNHGEKKKLLLYFVAKSKPTCFKISTLSFQMEGSLRRRSSAQENVFFPPKRQEQNSNFASHQTSQTHYQYAIRRHLHQQKITT